MSETQVRQPIGKKLRFEVFARDSYQCVYCGRSPPLVVLHVDHQVAVAEGGTNEDTNLVTACADCNLGKGRSVVPAPRAMPSLKEKLETLQEVEEQLTAYRTFLGDVRAREDQGVGHVSQFWSNLFGNKVELNETGLSKVRGWLKYFPPEKVIEAMDIASTTKSDPVDHFQYAGGILRNWKRALENPEAARLDEGVRRAAAFWRKRSSGGGWIPRGGEADLRRSVDALGLERVIEEMKRWGRSTYFESFVEHLDAIASPPEERGEEGAA